jgi:hypothetical protein
MIAPWIFLILTAIWFGFLGSKADGRWIRWSVGGALYALAATTMIIGLSNAAFIPLSHDDEVSHRFITLILASLPILVVGGFVMALLWRRGRFNRGPAELNPS